MRLTHYGYWATAVIIENEGEPVTRWYPDGDLGFLDTIMPAVDLVLNGKRVGHFMISGESDPYDLLYWNDQTFEFMNCAVVRASTIWEKMKAFKSR